MIFEKKQCNICPMKKIIQRVQKAILDTILKMLLFFVYYIGFGLTLLFVKIFKPALLKIKYAQADSFWLKAEDYVQSLEASARQS